MNAKQRNQNRDTAAHLRYSLMQYSSRNRRLEMPVKQAQQPQKAAS